MSDNLQTISPETLATEYVSPGNCEFYETKNGFLGAKIDGTEYKRVILMRALPLTKPDEYICISDIDRNEIGIIEKISGFSADQQKLINDELSKRYFCPVITETREAFTPRVTLPAPTSEESAVSAFSRQMRE